MVNCWRVRHDDRATTSSAFRFTGLELYALPDPGTRLLIGLGLVALRLRSRPR